MNHSLPTTQNATRALALALAATLGMALPAAAAPEGPPSFIQNTEQAYVMAPLTAFVAGSNAGLTLRNGLPGNVEWWLQNSTLGLSTAGLNFGTNLGGKYQWLQSGSGLASAVYADLRPSYTNAFGMGIDVGVPFSQSLTFGNISFVPNVNLNNLTSGLNTNLNLNVALIVPMGGGWLGTIQDVPSYALNGGGFTNNLSLGGRFVPANNTALDITVAQLAGSTFSAGILSVTGFVGF